MKLTYINHSCYCIENDKFNVVIDFYKDSADIDGYVYKNILTQDKKLYVLVTHSHLDHFNGEILDWRYKVENIVYVFSKEVLDQGMVKKTDDIIFLDKLEEYGDDNLLIRAYGSTDVGGSFYIEMADKKIFHAGDLNNWHWNEESTPEEVKVAETAYREELAILSRDVKTLDVAMFPIDPRLGKDFMKGAKEFIETINVKLIAPMHFSDEYEKIAAFDSVAKANKSNYFLLKEKGQSIII